MLTDVKDDVASLLQRQHGFDPRLSKKLVDSYAGEIKDWKSRGLTSVDIAIEIQQAAAQEGLQIQATVERAKLEEKQVTSRLDYLRARIAKLRNDVVTSKYHHGYSPPTTDIWMTVSEKGLFVGFHQYVPIAEILTHENVEMMVREATLAARRVWAQHPEGKIFSAIEMYEYGKDEVGSQKEVFMSDRHGAFAYGYQAHKGVRPELFEGTIRRKLKSMLIRDMNAVVIESITVKSFST